MRVQFVKIGDEVFLAAKDEGSSLEMIASAEEMAYRRTPFRAASEMGDPMKIIAVNGKTIDTITIQRPEGREESEWKTAFEERIMRMRNLQPESAIQWVRTPSGHFSMTG